MGNNYKLEKNIGEWRFDKEVTDIFDNHVRQSVPMYDEFHKMIADISQWFIEDNTNIYDIGTSTGECIKNLIKTNKYRNANFIGIDNSVDMYNEFNNRFKGCKNISITKGDVCSDDILLSNASFITSVLTMQFIPKRNRRIVLKKIYDGLNIGGAFIMVEKVISEDTRTDEIFTECYQDFKKEQGLCEIEIYSKARALRGVMNPNSINENINILKYAGFNNIEIFFKWFNFVGILAIK